jgi:hypothetical protein
MSATEEFAIPIPQILPYVEFEQWLGVKATVPIFPPRKAERS